jgi:hypothetical protein
LECLGGNICGGSSFLEESSEEGISINFLTKRMLESWANALDLAIAYEDVDFGQSVCTYRRLM